jgi:hypothetical protein
MSQPSAKMLSYKPRTPPLTAPSSTPSAAHDQMPHLATVDSDRATRTVEYSASLNEKDVSPEAVESQYVTGKKLIAIFVYDLLSGVAYPVKSRANSSTRLGLCCRPSSSFNSTRPSLRRHCLK